MYKLFIFSFLIISLAACRSAMNNPNSPQYSPIVEIETSVGTISVQLFAQTPNHRDNFLKLVKTNFYDGILFHRVINDFMIQAGDPNSRVGDKHDNDAQLNGATIPAEFDSTLVHLRGMLCAARMGDQVNPLRASSATQFYIVQSKAIQPMVFDQLAKYKGYIYTPEQMQAYKEQGGTPHLDREYTIFGKVVEGMDIVDKIAVSSNNEVKIVSTKIRK